MTEKNSDEQRMSEFEKGYEHGLFQAKFLVKRLLSIYMEGSKLSDKEKLDKFPDFVDQCLPLLINKMLEKDESK